MSASRSLRYSAESDADGAAEALVKSGYFKYWLSGFVDGRIQRHDDEASPAAKKQRADARSIKNAVISPTRTGLRADHAARELIELSASTKGVDPQYTKNVKARLREVDEC